MMAPQLYIAKSGARNAPSLPLDAVTRTFGVFGQRGTGKTNTAVVMAEEMVRKGAHVCIVDPVGAWWGITHEGEGKGLPGIVLGGEHGDVPLEETAGHLVAELVIGRHWPVVVIDMKMLRKGAQKRFLADFLEELYFSNREALHVFFEEADQVLPQNPRGMDPIIGRVLGAAEDIVKLGRGRGLGATLVSQRFATVNKNVTEQVQTLLLHTLTGPNDRKAAKLWIESNGDPSKTAAVLDTLAHLELGEAQLYSPGWLRVLERVRIKYRRTFDSSATPEVGAAPVEPGQRAPVDLDELRERMAETVERAKANDPAELRRRIAELEAEVEAARAEAPEPERILVPDREAVAELLMAITNLDGAGDEAHEMLQTALAAFRDAGETITAALSPVAEHVASLRVAADVAAKLPRNGWTDVEVADMAAIVSRPPRGASAPAYEPPPAATPMQRAVAEEAGISAGAAKLLDEMRGLAPLRLTRTQLATILRRGKRSSTLTQQLAELRDAGAIETDSHGRIAAVASPVANAPAMTKAQMIERWRSALPEGPRALLDVLLRNQEMTRDALFEQAGFSPTSSTPVTHLKLLRDNGLAYAGGGVVMLGEELRG